MTHTYALDVQDHRGKWMPCRIAGVGEARGLRFSVAMATIGEWMGSCPFTYKRQLRLTNETTGQDVCSIPLREGVITDA